MPIFSLIRKVAFDEMSVAPEDLGFSMYDHFRSGVRWLRWKSMTMVAPFRAAFVEFKNVRYYVLFDMTTQQALVRILARNWFSTCPLLAGLVQHLCKSNLKWCDTLQRFLVPLQDLGRMANPVCTDVRMAGRSPFWWVTKRDMYSCAGVSLYISRKATWQANLGMC